MLLRGSFGRAPGWKAWDPMNDWKLGAPNRGVNAQNDVGDTAMMIALRQDQASEGLFIGVWDSGL